MVLKGLAKEQIQNTYEQTNIGFSLSTLGQATHAHISMA